VAIFTPDKSDTAQPVQKWWRRIAKLWKGRNKGRKKFYLDGLGFLACKKKLNSIV
jgi:hypothetical protein